MSLSTESAGKFNLLDYYSPSKWIFNEQTDCAKIYVTLVLQQHCIDGYRAIQSVQDKAWVADNGYSLGKTHNAVLDALGCSLRASQKAVIHVVALFVKGRCTMPQKSISCKVRLVANRFLTRCIHQYNIVGVLVQSNKFRA